MQASELNSEAPALEFDVEQWRLKHDLQTGTMKMLLDEGFDSVNTISRLTPGVIDFTFGRDMTMAQKLLLADAAYELKELQHGGDDGGKDAHIPAAQISGLPQGQMTAQAAHSSQNVAGGIQNIGNLQDKVNQGGTLSITDVLNLMAGISEGVSSSVRGSPHMAVPSATAGAGPLGSMNLATGTQAGTSNGMFDLSSLGIMGAPSKTQPFRDVRDFVTLAPATKADYLVDVGPFQIKVKDGKIPLNRLSQSQYMEGAMKILLEMMNKDKCSMSVVINYVNYVVKVSTFAQAFEWPSVVQFDHEYRKLQTEQGFPWGQDNPYLMQLLLRSRQSSDKFGQPQRTTSQTTGRGKYDPHTARPICERFNGKHGCSLRVCKYSHVCISCFSPTHGDFTHRGTGAHKTNSYGINSNQCETKNGK